MLNRDFTLSAVIFDMDGLMLDTERVARKAWGQAMAEWGYELTDSFYFTIMGKTITDIRSIFLQTYGPDLPIAAIIGQKHLYMDTLLAEEGVPLKAGLSELLDRLERWKLGKAVASSTARRAVMDMLSRANVVHRFEVIIGGEDALRSKPAPDLFLAAAERLRVPPSGCVVLEDSEAGIRAAHAAGMVPVMIPDLVTPTEEMRNLAEAVLPSLFEAGEFLARRGRYNA